MSHPIYINPDEEIISVIARLRETPESDVVFVFPKRSVVTQSTINLKLLAREAEKQQKKVTVVSQNENTLALAQRIGLATLPYTSDMQSTSEKIEMEMPEILENKPVQQSVPNERPKIRDIGSSSFLVTEAIHPDKPVETAPSQGVPIVTPQTPVATPITPPSGQGIRIRNMSPAVGPGLNSLSISDEPLTPRPTPRPEPQPKPLASPSGMTPSSLNSSLRDFYTRTEKPEPARKPTPQAPVKPAPDKPKLHIEKKSLSYGLWGFGGVSILVLIAFLFLLILPKAAITVTPYQITDGIDHTLTLSTDGQGAVPLSKLPQEITVTLPGIASGAPSGTVTSSGQKASGTIKITNTADTDQPLVATTRFQSEDGKIYRISDGVTVPKSGSVEAKVVADGTGESYNKEGAKFTIPGLKGTEKYEAVTAETVTALSGGGGEESQNTNTFIKADADTLRSQAETKAREEFAKKVNNEGSTYTFTESIPAELKSESGLPKVGSSPGTYEYTATFALTPYTLSKDDVMKQLEGQIRYEYDGITFKSIASRLEFMTFSLNENGTEASIKVHLDVALASDINESSLKDTLAGKNQSDITELLESHPEIQKIAITFKPKWSLQRVPRDRDKIDITILHDPSLPE